MFTKSHVLATIAGAIFNFIGGYLVWGMATTDFFAQHAGTATEVMKDPPNLIFIALGCLIEACLISFIYDQWANGNHSAGGGFKLGALIGALTGFGVGLIMYGSTNLSDLTAVIAEGVIEIIFFGILGAIIASVYKATSKKEA
jgi:hypothetical protein